MVVRYERSSRSVKRRTKSACSEAERSFQCRARVRRAISSKSNKPWATRRISARRWSPSIATGRGAWTMASTRETDARTSSRGPVWSVPTFACAPAGCAPIASAAGNKIASTSRQEGLIPDHSREPTRPRLLDLGPTSTSQAPRGLEHLREADDHALGIRDLEVALAPLGIPGHGRSEASFHEIPVEGVYAANPEDDPTPGIGTAAWLLAEIDDTLARPQGREGRVGPAVRDLEAERFVEGDRVGHLDDRHRHGADMLDRPHCRASPFRSRSLYPGHATSAPG